MNTEAITAIRTWKNSKATITVTFPDGTTATRSGALAGRAEAVRVFHHEDVDSWFIFGLRGNAQRAQAEARKAQVPSHLTVFAILVTEG